jgi:transcriptional regulator NrdR family protein
MSSFHQKEVQMSEPLPCPECGAEQMKSVVENCRFDDGLLVKRLRHHKCLSCKTRFFTDEAMHRIQAERAEHTIVHAKGVAESKDNEYLSD